MSEAASEEKIIIHFLLGFQPEHFREHMEEFDTKTTDAAFDAMVLCLPKNEEFVDIDMSTAVKRLEKAPQAGLKISFSTPSPAAATYATEVSDHHSSFQL